ncbi:hypothetical protein IWW38_000058 [Coemansia aciculifera]|uniref:Uncharacterized protein n=1 Tax=Coemansia aciculifera TaxID=417176 RepID=A0ACC1MC12_9FUNG|nr:hypothetical protein IWW38_000058 [Coemansia aciculifera]
MSSGNNLASSTTTDPSTRFISESVIEDARREREAAWQKAYESGEVSSSAPPPTDADYDPRTLYERLKEQRQKKDESYAESRRFANQIKTLDSEETEFLESIDEHALEKQRAERQAEVLALAQFKDQVAERRQPPLAAASGNRMVPPASIKEGRVSAIAAIATAVRSRPKRVEPLEQPDSSAKRLRPADRTDDPCAISDSPPPPAPSGDNALNALLASYGSDGDSDANDSE